MKNQHKQMTTFILSIISAFASGQIVLADAIPSAATSAPTATPAVPVVTQESPRAALGDMAETLRRLYRASIDLVTEVSRHNEVPMQGRQVMIWDNMYSMYNDGTNNSNIMVPTVDGPVLPPRKKFVDQSMEQINKLTKILAADVASLPIPSSGAGKEAGEKRAQTEVANDSVKSLETSVVALNEKTQGPTYDNAAIEKSAKALAQQYAGLDALRKRLEKMYDKR